MSERFDKGGVESGFNGEHCDRMEIMENLLKDYKEFELRVINDKGEICKGENLKLLNCKRFF